MAIAIEGGQETVLAIPSVSVPAMFDTFHPELPAHNWQDSAATGKGVMYYCQKVDMLPAAVEVLTQLPTFAVSAVNAAKANWPAGIAQVGNQVFPTDATGTAIPGSQPMNILPTPLRQLRADESIQIMDAAMVPEVVTSAAAADPVVGPGGPTQAQWQTILDAANKVLGG